LLFELWNSWSTRRLKFNPLLNHKKAFKRASGFARQLRAPTFRSCKLYEIPCCLAEDFRIWCREEKTAATDYYATKMQLSPQRFPPLLRGGFASFTPLFKPVCVFAYFAYNKRREERFSFFWSTYFPEAPRRISLVLWICLRLCWKCCSAARRLHFAFVQTRAFQIISATQSKQHSKNFTPPKRCCISLFLFTLAPWGETEIETLVAPRNGGILNSNRSISSLNDSHVHGMKQPIAFQLFNFRSHLSLFNSFLKCSDNENISKGLVFFTEWKYDLYFFLNSIIVYAAYFSEVKS